MAQPAAKCLFFDVFGTCVDWRTSVTDELWTQAKEALGSASSSIATRIRISASDMTYEQWGELAQEWRNGYLKFTREVAANTDSNKPYKTIDEHHLESLRSILTERGLIFPRTDDTPAELVHDGSLWDEQQIQELSMVWHRLNPWPDTCQGILDLNKMFMTCTLSNGNLTLLDDMCKYGKMEFTHIYSAEMFQSYKPSPKVYLGAAEKMGLKPEVCVMVAAHLDDLKAAKANGFRTIYVERPLEERRPELREEGFVDVWVEQGENGFITAAQKSSALGKTA
ncbi:hypothetical protein LTR56_019035 [Elasticomyces elasticus]|nr:hypothetical protein LTR56_019035 [Elasticomyces elasticus]KAK3635380.1 hypothetical protein LTR22_019188 [Elasticomyces elasticus]KAK4911771.1 hypothetical protein LTR49_019668 [Elasticomyces elasticus]KAK5751288.1 hypothetical protein LTS12_018681 [Elasticomyces elasticus]